MLKVVLSDGQQRGSVFAPIHWSGDNASSARVGELVAPQTDPFSGQPEAKATPASVAPVDFRLSRIRAAPRAVRACRTEPGGRASRCPARHGMLLCHAMTRPMAWHELAPDLFPRGGS